MSSQPETPPGSVCDYCGRRFPHLGYQPAPGVTKWFCNKTCKNKWEKRDDRKPPAKIELPKMRRTTPS